MSEQLLATDRGPGIVIPGTFWVLLDALMIMIFATVGRSSHGGADSATQVIGVAAPFLLGAGVGWLLVWLRGRPRGRGLRSGASLRAGAIVLGCAVVIGLGYRLITGTGAPAFLVVAILSLTLLLLGWRLLAAGIRRMARTRTV